MAQCERGLQGASVPQLDQLLEALGYAIETAEDVGVDEALVSEAKELQEKMSEARDEKQQEYDDAVAALEEAMAACEGMEDRTVPEIDDVGDNLAAAIKTAEPLAVDVREAKALLKRARDLKRQKEAAYDAAFRALHELMAQCTGLHSKTIPQLERMLAKLEAAMEAAVEQGVEVD